MQKKRPNNSGISRPRIVIVAAAAAILLTLLGLTFSNPGSGQDTKTESTLDSYTKRQLCGPFSLHTAAALLGVQIDFPKLVEECKPSDKGLSMDRLRKLARKFGLDAEGYRLTWQDLINLPSPAILHITPDHFVTVVAPDTDPGDRIRVFDGDNAPQWWSRTKMADLWSGPALVVSKAPSRPARNKPKISFESLVFDLGDVEVPMNEKRHISMHFTNLGARPLELGKVRASCGCTEPLISQEIVEPGLQGQIDLAIDLDRARGPFNYTVSIESNDPLTPLTKTRITGRAYNTQLTDRKDILFDAVPRGGRSSKTLLLQDPGDGSLRAGDLALRVSSRSFGNTDENIAIKAACTQFDPNLHQWMGAKEQDVLIDIEVVVSEQAPLGDYDAILEIGTQVRNNEKLQIPLRGTVITNITARPAALFFPIRRGQTVEKDVTIEAGTGPLVGLKDVFVSAGLPVTVETQNPQKVEATVLRVRCTAPKDTLTNTTGDLECRFVDDTILRIPVVIHVQPDG